MVRGIFVYFLLVFCLLTKDGLSFALNVLDEKSSVYLEMNFEGSMEEDESEDLWHEINLGSGLSLLPALKKEKSKIGYTNSFLLLVHLEHVGPPPKYA
jgi:hypothetical protein